ncbi:MAG: single-stranded-DNA-specific exonuclease RecJ [Chelatococcus sp.]|uniref:single-stranded-DNA-specific exonuclease RecJ n=1 Tax=Chelatococcus sp. TaxID=1953771 RepID=UPI0025BE2492|nr:single-stranded-DNA-specific exonuclease RecJ [Chelatococcus sp.]MBX3539504.1 single-stranded-DNA-specific exonuclease RecJ [Chelatococcus sp.]
MWRDRLDDAGAAAALAMVQSHGLPDIVARILAARGIAGADASGYLEPRLRDLMPDPSILRDMEPAVDRLAAAIVRDETVAVFGDYDVDGACSTALLASFLARCGTRFVIHIPDRITEGYGPNVEAIRALKAEGADLLVTVDCGTTSFEPLAEAARLHLDAVVIDHHQAPQELPQAVAIINPNRQDDLSGLGHLAAAGVVFMVLVALNRRLRGDGFWDTRGGAPDLLGDLDLVALATVADVVRLEGLNRAFVRQGLGVMRQRRRPGLTALLDAAALRGPPEAWHLGFLVGPRINAGGRIGDAALGAKLLLTDDGMAAAQIASELDRLNRERQVIEHQAVEEATADAERQLSERDAAVLVVGSAEWHPGIVGLVAARLKEHFRRPAFAFALTPGGSTGSGRSIPGVDLGRAVRAAVDAGLAVKGGGHAMAAGITLAPDGLETFSRYLDSMLAEAVAGARLDSGLSIDAAVTAGGASPALIAGIAQAGPYGSGNPEPVFAFPRHRLAEVSEVKGHIRVSLKAGDGSSLGGMAFRSADRPLGQALLAARGQVLHVAGTLALDTWGGQAKASLRVLDVAEPAR